MKILIALASCLIVSQAIAGDEPAPAATTLPKVTMHRYLVERTFPPGALRGLDSATKKKVNDNNSSVGVSWVESYANADETKTFCVYKGPNEAAVRKAAELNKLPVDSITEVPVTLTPQ